MLDERSHPLEVALFGFGIGLMQQRLQTHPIVAVYWNRKPVLVQHFTGLPHQQLRLQIRGEIERLELDSAVLEELLPDHANLRTSISHDYFTSWFGLLKQRHEFRIEAMRSSRDW